MVPLWFINREYRQFKLILLSTPFMESQNIYQFGQCIGDAVESSSERVVYIASGDMSHGLTHDAPAGYRESGSDYDAQIRRIVEAEDVHALLSISADEMEQAAECGTRSIIMMYGALKNNLLESRLYSYEGPFGVGYLCASIQTSDAKRVNMYDSHAKQSTRKFYTTNAYCCQTGLARIFCINKREFLSH
jgi:aromatic ring-opening dioxygenase LigB subunit